MKNRKRTKHAPSAVRIVNEVIVAALVIVTLSGVLLYPLENAAWLAALHKLSGVVLFLGAVAHMRQHGAGKYRTEDTNEKRRMQGGKDVS